MQPTYTPVIDPVATPIGELWHEHCASCRGSLGSIHPLCEHCAQVDDPVVEDTGSVLVLMVDPGTTPAQTLRAAAGYLHHFGWFQDDMFDDPDSPTPCACPLGAIRMATLGTPVISAESLTAGQDTWIGLYDTAVAVFADHLIRVEGARPVITGPVTLDDDREQVVIGWNDHPNRIAAHVIAALHAAADDWDRIHPALPQVCPHKRPIGACECDAATELDEFKAELLAETPDGVR